ncbi:MAG: NAD(P)/FAD-dependent oxidoreductase [Pseudomonadota bacterium]
MMSNKADVIVVGAGPVGLITALGLAQQNLRVIVLDKDKELNDSPRAQTYMDPTLQLLERLGIVDKAEEVGVRCGRINWVWPADDLVLPIYTKQAEPNRVYPYNIHFGQEVLGSFAMDAFLKHSQSDVRFDHRVTAIDQGVNGATVKCETPSGVELLHADWVIGADGASSTVRDILGLEVEGFTWPDRFITTNVHYDFEKHGWANVHMICNGDDWGLVSRITRDDLWRVTFGEDANGTMESWEAAIPKHYKSIMPTDDLYEVDSWAPYRVHERCCPTFFIDRVILAGDSAHLCNPCGGRGLTGGLQDVDHLLQAFERLGQGADPLKEFSDYSDVRRRVFLEVNSPFATLMKETWQRTDREKQREDQERMKIVAAGKSKISLTGIEGRQKN